MVIKKGVCVLGILALMIFMIGVVSAATRWVDDGGDDLENCLTQGLPCATIQRGINVADANDIVTVGAGNYNEDLTINTAGLTLNSTSGTSATNINGTIIVNASSVTVGGSSGHGFHIFNMTETSPSLYTNYLISINQWTLNTIEVSYNIINVSNTSINAIVLGNVSGLTIHENNFHLGSNISSLSSVGISSFDMSNISSVSITNNTFDNLGIGSTSIGNFTAILFTYLNVSTSPSLIAGNTIDYAHRGIVLGNHTAGVGIIFGSSWLRINNNTFYKNNISIDILSVDAGTESLNQNITITNNNFSTGWTYGIAINASIEDTDGNLSEGIRNNVSQIHPANFTVSGNIFSGNAIAIKNLAGMSAVRERTLIAENNFWGAASGPAGAVGGGSGGGNGTGDNVTIYVDYSPWYINLTMSSDGSNNTQVGISAGDFQTLQPAIGNASYGDIIEVANGTYTENISISRGITLQSYEGAGNTTINGTITFNGAANDSVLGGTDGLGFTVLYPLGLSELILLNAGTDNIEISYNTINVTNISANIPIAISISTLNISGLTIHKNIFNLNATASGIITDNGIAEISSLSITNNTFSSYSLTTNYTSAIHIVSLNVSTSPSLIAGNTIKSAERGIVIGNRTDGEGIIFNNSWLRINNNTFYKNNISIDIVNTAGPAENYSLQNITITNNNITASYAYGISINTTGAWDNYLESADFTIYNNIFSGNAIAINNSLVSNLTAELNFWGNTSAGSSGGGSPGNEGGNGDNVTDSGGIAAYIDYNPWYTSSNLTVLSNVTVAVAAAATTTTTADNPGGSPAAVKTWTKTYNAETEELESVDGYNRKLAAKHRIKFKVNDTSHQVGVKSLTVSTATIQISSEVQEANLVIGDIRKFDVTDDGFYDLSIKLNGIDEQKADIVIKKIYEQITVEAIDEETEKEKEAAKIKEQEEEEARKRRIWTWIIIGIIVVVLILVGAGYGIKKKRK